MKSISLILLGLVFSIALFSKALFVSGVAFIVDIDRKPLLFNTSYQISLMDADEVELDTYYSIIKKELSKYPENVLETLLPRRIYIVENIIKDSSIVINGVARDDSFIILRRRVFTEERLNDVIHHEIFHVLLNKAEKIKPYFRNRVEYLKSCFNRLNNKLEDSDCSFRDFKTYNCEYISGYHPSAEEDICEVFSVMMLSENEAYQQPLLQWRKNTSKYDETANPELCRKIDYIIDFTQLVTGKEMNREFYLNLTTH